MLFMRKILGYAFLSLGLLLLCTMGYSQQKIVSGVVTSAIDQAALSGVTVSVKGTNEGTLTDETGRFSVSAHKGQTLQFTSVGFQESDVIVADETTINIRLSTLQNTLSDNVVVGYGTQKKANLTGAVSVVDVNKTFGSKPLTDPAKALQGVVPGLTILYGNGGLTAGATINIRGIGSVNGSSRPLIYFLPFINNYFLFSNNPV